MSGNGKSPKTYLMTQLYTDLDHRSAALDACDFLDAQHEKLLPGASGAPVVFPPLVFEYQDLPALPMLLDHGFDLDPFNVGLASLDFLFI